MTVPTVMTVILRVLTSLLVLGVCGLLAFSLLIGSEQEWGLRHRPFPVLLWPVGVVVVGLLYTWLIWRTRAQALAIALLLLLCVITGAAVQFRLLH